MLLRPSFVGRLFLWKLETLRTKSTLTLAHCSYTNFLYLLFAVFSRTLDFLHAIAIINLFWDIESSNALEVVSILDMLESESVFEYPRMFCPSDAKSL